MIPYRVSRHNAWLEACPEAGAEVEAERARLDCLATLHDVRIDGDPVAQLRFDAFEDPDNGVEGMLAMIPVRALAHGRHELTLLAPPHPDRASPPLTYRIPFWR